MIAIIPARGGSKGLPRKNILDLCGKPLISYTVEAALKAAGIDRVFVSTDSSEIAEIAVQYGAEVPRLRPDYLAEDTSSAVDVYIHAVEYLSELLNEKIEHFMVLLPTAPLRTHDDIEEAIRLWESCQASTLVSMTKADTPVSWYHEVSDEGYIRNAGFEAENVVLNRQLNKGYFIPNGAIYILSYRLLKEKRTYYDDKTAAYIMPKERSVDIDDRIDFKLAELLMRDSQRGGI